MQSVDPARSVGLEALGFCFKPLSGQPSCGMGSRDQGPLLSGLAASLKRHVSSVRGAARGGRMELNPPARRRSQRELYSGAGGCEAQPIGAPVNRSSSVSHPHGMCLRDLNLSHLGLGLPAPGTLRWHPLDVNNLQVLCEDCNHGKGNWDQTDWRPEATDSNVVSILRDIAKNG